METVVLPAQDHLAQERYRYQSRMMSGMIYPLGGLPRTRRKVKTPSQVISASLHSEEVRAASSQNMRTVEARNTLEGAAANLDLTFGILRGARFSSSPPTRHTSGLSTPQYRLHSTQSQGFTRNESTRSEATSPVHSKQQHVASPFSTLSLLNGSTACPAPVVRTRSDGELLSCCKKGGEVEKTSERRKSFERNFDTNKNGYERKPIDKMVERYEKPVDKRKILERKPIEKKAPFSKHVDEKPISPPKKGIITILQRPQTKEAAAENLAKITGIAVESLQAVKSNRAHQQVPVDTTQNDVDPVSSVVSSEDLDDKEVGSKDVESGNSNTTRGRPGSPKGGKKKSVRGENNRGPAVRTHANVEKVGKASLGNNGHSARVYAEKEEKNKVSQERREASPTSSNSSRDAVGASKPVLLSPGILNLSSEDYSSAQSLSDSQSRKSNARIITSIEGGHRSSEEYVGKQHGFTKSDSFRDAPCRSESCDANFLPSSPPTTAAERWAGPAYTNSPPPSTLPFPTFPTQRAKSSLNGVSLSGFVDSHVPEMVPVKSSSAPSSPTRVSSALFCDNRAQAPRVDPSSATKDLRRILNLDVECAADVEAEASVVPSDMFRVASFLKAKEQQSATQGLKRILQLG